MHPIGPYVLSLVDPSVNVDVPCAARTVDRMPAHEDLGELSVEIRDAVRLGVLAVEPRPRQKLMNEERSTPLPRAGAGNDIATRYWKGRDATARSRAWAAKRQEAARANKYSQVSDQHSVFPYSLQVECHPT